MGNCVAFKCTEKDDNDQPERAHAQPTRRAPRKVPILKSPMDSQLLVRRHLRKYNTATSKESHDNLLGNDLPEENRNPFPQNPMKLLDSGTDLANMFKKISHTERTKQPLNIDKDLKIQGNHYRKSRGFHTTGNSNSNIKRLKSYSIYHSYESLDYNYKSPASVECQ